MTRADRLLAEHVAQLGALTWEARARVLRLVCAQLRRLRARVYALPGDAWSESIRDQVLLALAGALGTVQRATLAELTRELERTWVLGARGVARELTVLDQAMLGVAPGLRWDVARWYADQVGAYSKARITTMETSLRRYGAATASQVTTEIAGAATVGDSWADVRPAVWRRVERVVQGRQWMVDRIIATEMSAAFNGARLQAMVAEDAVAPRPEDRMLKRLVATFDDRTGRDSYLQAGQTVPVRQPFVDVKSGRAYMAPPNRPHDREIVVPWRLSYAVDFPHYDRETHADEQGRDTTEARRAALRSELARLRVQRDGLAREASTTGDPGYRAALETRLAQVDAQIGAAQRTLAG